MSVMNSVSRLLKGKPKPCFVPRARPEGRPGPATAPTEETAVEKEVRVTVNCELVSKGENPDQGNDKIPTTAGEVADSCAPISSQVETSPSVEKPSTQVLDNHVASPGVELTSTTSESSCPSETRAETNCQVSDQVKGVRIGPRFRPKPKPLFIPRRAKPSIDEPVAKNSTENAEKVEALKSPVIVNEKSERNVVLPPVIESGTETMCNIPETNIATEVRPAEACSSPVKPIRPPLLTKPVFLHSIPRPKAQPTVAPDIVKGILHERPRIPSSTFGRLQKEIQENFIKKFGDGPPDPNQLTMVDLIFYNPTTNPMSKQEDEVVTVNKTTPNGGQGGESEENADKSGNVALLTLDSEGNIIISDEPSNQKIVEKENPVKTRHAWSRADTIKFYKALHRLGADFSMMTQVFPDRDRKNLKSKFKREERLNPTLINKVLSNPAQFCIEALQQELNDVGAVTKTQNGKLTKKKRDSSLETIGGKRRKLADKQLGGVEVTPNTFQLSSVPLSWESNIDLLERDRASNGKLEVNKQVNKEVRKYGPKKGAKPLVRSLQAIIAEQEREENVVKESDDTTIIVNTLVCQNFGLETVRANTESMNEADINITIEHDPETL